MKINKITMGYVIQTYDTETDQWIDQAFIAADSEWETWDGKPLILMEVPDKAMNSYLPFDMVQPSA